MRVEPGRDDDEVGPEALEPRQDRGLERLAEDVAAVAGPQRRIDDGVAVAALGDGAGAGIERHLVGRAVHHRAVAPEDVLRAVAVMDVPVDDRDALGAMRLLRVPGGDRGIVEEAEPHGAGALGVMAGRAHRREGVPGPPRHHLVDGLHGGADAAQHRLQGARRHGRVGVDRDHAVARRHLLDRLHVGGRMGELGHRRGAERRRLADEPGETLVLERPIDRPDAVGALGMAGRRLVVERGGMAQEKRRHAWASALGTGFAALSQPTPELSMTGAIAAVTAMQHGRALRPWPCPRGFRIGSAGRNPRAA